MLLAVLHEIVIKAREKQRLRYSANYTNAIALIKLSVEKVIFRESQLNQATTTTATYEKN